MGWWGLECARQLHREWLAARHYPPGARERRLTDRVFAVGSHFGISPQEVKRCIDRTRRQLFGDVTDQAIYQALKRDEYLAAHAGELCRLVDCDNPLPSKRRKSRKFCSDRCTVRAHRHPELVASKPRLPAQAPLSALSSELTAREQWVLEAVDFRTQTGLRAEDVLSNLGVSSSEYDTALAKRDLLAAAQG